MLKVTARFPWSRFLTGRGQLRQSAGIPQYDWLKVQFITEVHDPTYTYIIFAPIFAPTWYMAYLSHGL